MSQLTATGFVVGDGDARVGEKAPAYSLVASRSGAVAEEPVALTDFRGKWLVMIFYPLAFSPVSQSELVAFDRWAAPLRARSTELLAISTDSPLVHRAWLRLSPQEGGLHGLSFPLASDVTHAVAQAYGVMIEDQGHAQRATFIVDPKGVIRYTATHDLAVGRSTSETVRVLSALATGVDCFADWQPESGV